MKPKNKRVVSRKIKFLALAVGLVILLLLVATIRVVVPSQFETTVVPDPMTYFQAHQPGVNNVPLKKTGSGSSVIPGKRQSPETGVRDAYSDIMEQHAAVWVVRRSAFLPIRDISNVPTDLRNSARRYNGEMTARLESATATLVVSEPSGDRGRIHPLRAASHEGASWFPKQADYLNPEFQQVWRDFCLRLSNLLDFRADGRIGRITFLGRDGSKLGVSDNFGSWVVSDVAELPEEILDVIAEWKATMAKISTSLLEAPADFSDYSFSESLRRLKDIDKVYERAMADFLPKFVGNDEFIILPSGIESWFETRSRAKLALCVSKEEWIRAAWTCHDDLRDNKQFAYYLKKAGSKGRWILVQETIEDKASDLGESIEDIVEDAIR